MAHSNRNSSSAQAALCAAASDVCRMPSRPIVADHANLNPAPNNETAKRERVHAALTVAHVRANPPRCISIPRQPKPHHSAAVTGAATEASWPIITSCTVAYPRLRICAITHRNQSKRFGNHFCGRPTRRCRAMGLSLWPENIFLQPARAFRQSVLSLSNAQSALQRAAYWRWKTVIKEILLRERCQAARSRTHPLDGSHSSFQFVIHR